VYLRGLEKPYTQAYHTHNPKVVGVVGLFVSAFGFRFFYRCFHQITLTVRVVVLAHHPEGNGVPDVFLIAAH
jgi:hypothetical protein